MDKDVTTQATAAVADAWSALTPVDPSLAWEQVDDKSLLSLVLDAQRLATRARAAAMLTLAELDRRGVCESRFGIDAAAWAADETHLARGTIRAEIRAAKEIVDENPVVAAQFRVTSIPTMNLYSGGEVVKQIVGARPKSVILKELADYIG